MTDVMTERSHTDDTPPIAEIGDVSGDNIPRLVTSDVRWVSQHVEDPSGQFHDTERMLKASVSGPRIDQVCHRQLVNVSQPLERP